MKGEHLLFLFLCFKETIMNYTQFFEREGKGVYLHATIPGFRSQTDRGASVVLSEASALRFMTS